MGVYLNGIFDKRGRAFFHCINVTCRYVRDCGFDVLDLRVCEWEDFCDLVFDFFPIYFELL